MSNYKSGKLKTYNTENDSVNSTPPFKDGILPTFNTNDNPPTQSLPFRAAQFLNYIAQEGCVFTLEQQLEVLKQYTIEFLQEYLTDEQLDGLQCDLMPYLEITDNELTELLE